MGKHGKSTHRRKTAAEEEEERGAKSIDVITDEALRALTSPLPWTEMEGVEVAQPELVPPRRSFRSGIFVDTYTTHTLKVEVVTGRKSDRK